MQVLPEGRGYATRLGASRRHSLAVEGIAPSQRANLVPQNVSISICVPKQKDIFKVILNLLFFLTIRACV